MAASVVIAVVSKRLSSSLSRWRSQEIDPSRKRRRQGQPGGALAEESTRSDVGDVGANEAVVAAAAVWRGAAVAPIIVIAVQRGMTTIAAVRGQRQGQ